MQVDDIGEMELFSLLLRKIQNHLDQLKKGIKLKVEKGGYTEAKTIIENAEDLRELRNDLKAISQRYEDLISDSKNVVDDLEWREADKKDISRLPKGLKTSAKAYRMPILKVLVAMGGKGETSDILELVHERMADRLNEYDYQELSSGRVRWRNTARWERNNMREEGLILDNSPVGIWEISEKGKEYLRNNK